MRVRLLTQVNSRRRSSTPTILPQLPSPPSTPDSDNENIPHRRRSDDSIQSPNSISDIERATRKLDIRTVQRLLDEDTTGELINTVDSARRTLIDIAICHGRSTDRSQVPLVKMLSERGVKFTLVEHQRFRKTYDDIVETIEYQDRTRNKRERLSPSG